MFDSVVKKIATGLKASTTPIGAAYCSDEDVVPETPRRKIGSYDSVDDEEDEEEAAAAAVGIFMLGAALTNAKLAMITRSPTLVYAARECIMCDESWNISNELTSSVLIFSDAIADLIGTIVNPKTLSQEIIASADFAIRNLEAKLEEYDTATTTTAQ